MKYSCTFISVSPRGRYIVSTRNFKDFFDLINEVWVLKSDHMWVSGEYRTEKYKNVFISSSLEGENTYEIELSINGLCFEENQIPFVYIKNLIFS